MAPNDHNQDDFEKVLGSRSEPVETGGEPGEFTRMFSSMNPGTGQPSPSQPPPNQPPQSTSPTPTLIPPVQPVQPREQNGAGPGDFTRVFGSANGIPAATNVAYNLREESRQPSFPEPHPGQNQPASPEGFTSIFGSSTNQSQVQLPTGTQRTIPESRQQPSFNQSLGNEPLGNRDGKSVTDDFARFYQEQGRKSVQPGGGDFAGTVLRPASDPAAVKPFAAEQVPGSLVIPSMGDMSSGSHSRRDSTEIFSNDKLQLNPIDVPGAPSAYTRVVRPSDLKTVSGNAGTPVASNPPQSAPAPQVMQMPPWQPMAAPQISVPTPNLGTAPQVSWTPPAVMPPQIAFPAAAQPPMPTPPQPLSPAQSGASKWAPYMPLIIAMNVFLLLALFLIVIVFILSKK